MGSLVDALPYFSVEIIHETINEFKAFYGNGFLVLPDAKTVVGADASDPKKLMMEDINQGNPTEIGRHSSWILNVSFDSLTETLLVGDRSGHVKQYKKNQKSKFFGLLKDPVTFTLLKDYGDVGVGWVLSSALVGRFAIFGGINHCLVAIDISKKRLCTGVIKSPLKWNYSFEVCHGSDSNVYLCVGGCFPKYSSDVSDFLDVTRLYNGNKSHISQLPEEINQSKTNLDKKDETIDTLKLKIKQLRSELRKQKKQNKGTAHKKNLKTKSTLFSKRTSPCF